MQAGFIGLGQMGAPMAANLIKAGHAVTVYNRTPQKAAALTALGAKLASNICDACRGEAVISMLADDNALESIAFQPGGIIDALPKGALHISCSTISVFLLRRLHAAHTKAGQRYIAAPVFGRPEAAAVAKLFVVAGDASKDIKTATPLLSAIGQRIFEISDLPDATNLVKLSGNSLIATVIESLGEAMALVSKAGIDQHAYLELLTSTLFGAPICRTYGTLIANAQFSPAGFAAPLGLKDIRLVLAAAEELPLPLPMASLLRDRFLSLLAQGGEDLDWSAIATLSAGAGRLDGPPK